MLCAEYWAWQFLAIISGNLGVEAQANMMITMQVAALANTICLGIQEASCVVVGHQIGANNIQLAKKFTYMTLF